MTEKADRTRQPDPEAVREADARVHDAYEQTQTLRLAESVTDKGDLGALTDNWKDEQLPQLQRRVADVQLQNLTRGIIDPVFQALRQALQDVELSSFSILDAACATGYYSEVIRALDSRPIAYAGCDYSPAMIESARRHYPDTDFSVQDLTELALPDRSTDVVLVSGVLEHVPDFDRAIGEVCRVARSHVIVHRCPLTSSGQHEHTVGSQYNIRTPRTYFSLPLLREEFRRSGFLMTRQISLYGTSPRGVGFLVEMFRRLLARRTVEGRHTATLVFQRKDTRDAASR